MMYFEDVFEFTQYPAGERHVRIKEHMLFTLYGPIVATKVRNFDDLMMIRTANEILKHNGLTSTWVIPYFPFARHDRRNDAYDGLELKIAMELMEDVTLTIIDPHSDVAGQLRHISQGAVVDLMHEHGLFDVDNPLVVIPDNGATKKAYQWLTDDLPYVQGYKTRDVKTGKLSGFGVMDAEKVEGSDVIIIDDICDAGGTFLGLADVLLGHGANSLKLAVTHGLFTKGLDKLSDSFQEIWTLDCYTIDDYWGALKTVPLEELMEFAYT